MQSYNLRCSDGPQTACYRSSHTHSMDRNNDGEDKTITYMLYINVLSMSRFMLDTILMLLSKDR